MGYQVPEFVYPDFTQTKFKEASNVQLAEVEIEGVAPDNFYLTSHMPTFYKLNEEWVIPEHNSLNCVAVV